LLSGISALSGSVGCNFCNVSLDMSGISLGSNSAEHDYRYEKIENGRKGNDFIRTVPIESGRKPSPHDMHYVFILVITIHTY